MNICILSGSARPNNNTVRAGKALKKLIEPSHQVKLIDFVTYDLPMLGQAGMNPNNLSIFQKELFQSMEEAHIVFILSPEYNWSTTPELLNLLNYLPNKPFQHLLNNKVFAFLGVSSGKGGKAPALHLMQIVNKIISFSNSESMVSPKIFETHFIKEVIDEEGNLLQNEMFNAGMTDFCNYTLRIADRWFK